MAEKDLTNEVLALPQDEQLKLVDAIMSNMADEEIHPDWPDELRRRAEVEEAGKLELISGDSFKAELDKRLGE